MLGPTLETDRLLLRPPEITDFDAWCEMMADEEAARFVGGAMPRETVFRVMATMTGLLPPPFGIEVDIYGQSRETWRKQS